MTRAAAKVEAEGDAGSGGRGWSRVGEVVGGTAAVCCCCPCTVMHLLILAVYKLPAGIWKKRKNKKNKKSHQERRLLRSEDLTAASVGSQPEVNVGPRLNKNGPLLNEELKNDDDTKSDFEMHMLDQFYNRGFWRSSSHKED